MATVASVESVLAIPLHAPSEASRRGWRPRKMLGVALLAALALEIVVLPVVVLQRKQDVRVLRAVPTPTAQTRPSVRDRMAFTPLDEKALAGIVVRALRSAPAHVGASVR